MGHKPKVREVNLDELAVIDALDTVGGAANEERFQAGKKLLTPAEYLQGEQERSLDVGEEMDIEHGKRWRTTAEQLARDQAREAHQQARRDNPISTDFFDRPDIDQASLVRTNTRVPEKVGYAMDQKFLVHINREFLRGRAIARRGPLSLDEAMELLRQRHPDWYAVLELRTTQDLKQREVAEELSLGRRTVSNYEQRALQFLQEQCQTSLEADVVLELLEKQHDRAAS